MDVFQGQDYEGSRRTNLEAFRGELLEFVYIQSTESPELVDRFVQRLSAAALVPGAIVPGQFPVSCLIVRITIFPISEFP